MLWGFRHHQEWNEFIPSKSWGSTLPSLKSSWLVSTYTPPRERAGLMIQGLWKSIGFPFEGRISKPLCLGRGLHFLPGRGNQPSQKSPRSWRRVKWRLQSSRSTFTTPSEGEWRNTFRKRGLTLLHCCDRGGGLVGIKYHPIPPYTTLYIPILPIVSIVPHYTTLYHLPPPTFICKFANHRTSWYKRRRPAP